VLLLFQYVHDVSEGIMPEGAIILQGIVIVILLQRGDEHVDMSRKNDEACHRHNSVSIVLLPQLSM
jgi:hypothetical protein